MSTAQDIMTASLKELRVYAPGESINDADFADGLLLFNRMLDYLSNDGAACYAVTELALPLVVNQQTYTIGSGGNLNVTRPLKVFFGGGAARVVDGNNVAYDVDIWPQDRWNELGYPTQTANFPTVAFYDPQYPLAKLNVYPVPNQAYTLYFDSYLQLGNLANYTTQLSFPPGYEAMLQHNLSVWWKPYYKSAQLDPIIERLAVRTLNAVKRTNRRQNMAEYDPELMVRGSASYNIYDDSYAR